MEQLTTLPYISVPLSLTSSNTTTMLSQLVKEQEDFLRIARNKLKLQVFNSRQDLLARLGRPYNICPSCRKEVYGGDLHEWLITRGDVRGAPFEWQMQIYVPCNVVICHSGHCHIDLQHGEEGARKCQAYITQWHIRSVLDRWLYSIREVITIAEEKERWLWSYSS